MFSLRKDGTIRPWIRSAIPGGVLVFALYGALAWLALHEDYWGDEGLSIKRIGASWRQLYYPFAIEGPNEPFEPTFVWDFNPPLYYAVIRLFAGAHSDRFAIRGFSILPMMAAVWLLARWAVSAFGAGAGVTALALASLSPAVLYYGHEARPYALALACVAALSTLALRRGGLARGGMFEIAALSCAGCLTHFYAAFPLLSLGAVAAWRLSHPGDWMDRKSAQNCLAGIALGVALAGLLIYPQRALFGKMAYISEAGAPLSWRAAAHLFALPLFGPGEYPPAPFWLGATLQILVFVFAALLLRGSRHGGLVGATLALWLGPCAMALAVGAMTPSPLNFRYGLFALPGWLMTLAWLASEGQRRKGFVRVAVGALLAGTAVVGGINALPFFLRPIRAPWRAAIEILHKEGRSADGYTIHPVWLNSAFAANSGSPPAPAYFGSNGTALPEGGRFWVVAEPWTSEPYFAELGKAGWTIKRRIEKPSMELWEATKGWSP